MNFCHHMIKTDRGSADKGGDGKKQVHVEGLLLKKWTSGSKEARLYGARELTRWIRRWWEI